MLLETTPGHAVLPVDGVPYYLPPTNTSVIAAGTDVNSILQIISAAANTHWSGATSGNGVETPSMIYVPEGGGGVGYVDWSTEYGWWDSGGGVDYSGSNYMSDGPEPTVNDAPPAPHIPSSVPRGDGGHVEVGFVSTTLDGKPSDVPVSPQLAQVTGSVLSQTPGITSVNVNATTNGVHETKSDHYTGNAIDINNINGNTIRGNATGTNLALALEAQALADPNTRYVEGPGGNWARSSPGAQWIRSNDLPNMDNHVHISTFRH